MDTCFWECSFLPIMHVTDLPEFASFWHGPGLWNSIWVLTLLIVRSFGMLLISGMLMIWLSGWRITLVSGLMGAGNSIPLVVLRLLVPECIFLLLRRPLGVLLGVRLKSMVMPGWSVARHLSQCRVLSRLSSVLNSRKPSWYW